MRTFLSVFAFVAFLHQMRAAQLTVTVFYETLCCDSMDFFEDQMQQAYADKEIREKVFFELVPFGRANYTENPWSITCQHGSEECLGNVLDACFIAKNPENYKQVTMISCTMSDSYPPGAGEQCAKKLGYSYAGVEECSGNREGITLQMKNGRRTLDFRPELTFIPTIVYDNVYNSADQSESLTDLKGVIRRKLDRKSYDH